MRRLAPRFKAAAAAVAVVAAAVMASACLHAGTGTDTDAGTGGAQLAQAEGAQPAARAGDPLFDPSRSTVTAEGRDRGKPRPLHLHLAVGARAPFRAYLLDQPPRLVVEMEGLDLPAGPAAVQGADLLAGLRWGPGLPGWGRIIAALPGPYAVAAATITGRDGEAAAIELSLVPVGPEDFAPRADAMTALKGLPEPSELPPAVADDGRLRVVLDPGHGGFDPGAQVDGVSEAALMLQFSTELAAALNAAGIDARLTRGEDRFVPLEQRTTAARAVDADLFISLHADMLPKVQAAGATIYVWNPASNDRAAQELAARHDRDDMLAGVDLDGTDDRVARALIDLARTRTQPASEAFASHLSSELALSDIGMHRRPVQGAAFSVLKSPDIPSVLVELGFLSDPVDRANLLNPAWRAQMAGAITRAVTNWRADQAAAGTLRGVVPPAR